MIRHVKTAAAVFSIGVFAFFVGLFFVNPGFIKQAFSHASYYLILGLFLFWAATLAKVWARYRPDLKGLWRAYGSGVVFCVLACALVFVSVKPQFRVLADETNLLAVSKSMTFEHRVDNVTMGEWYYDNFYPISRETEKRPLLYPFLTSLLHTLTGFRPENAFAVNFILLAGLLSMIFVLVRRTWGALWAYSAVLLVLANPVVTQGATSGGFELSATFFGILSLVSLYYFLKTRDALFFQLLWANLLMLANTRYESFLFFLIIIPALFPLRYVPLSFLGTAWIFPLTPLFALPLVWQRMLHAVAQDPFQTPANVKAFSLAHFFDHIREFFALAVRFDYSLPYATPVFSLGIVVLVYFLLRSLRGHFQEYQRHFILISMLVVMTFWGVIAAHHFGTLLHPSASRFFIFHYVVLSLASLCLLRRVALARQDAPLIFFVSLLLFLLYHPVSVENRFCNTQILPRGDRIVAGFLAKQGSRNLLVITDRPGMYTARDYGAVSFAHANGQKETILSGLRGHLFRDIFVVQEILYGGLAPTKETTLDPQFKLSPVLEQQNTATSFIRISRVRI